VVFEDLQCPDCRKEHPRLLEAAAANHVPLVVHDFPIRRHKWAFPAAVLARYFEAMSPELGAQFRSYIFQNQPGIGVDNIQRFGEQFASSHGLTLPGNVDPDGKLAAAVQADYDLGTRVGLEYVPLIFVVGRGEAASRWVEVTDTATLGIAIEQMRQDVRATRQP
jgi:protein-disulfide isomerase